MRRRASRPWVLMEVCGGQTHGLLRHGIDAALEIRRSIDAPIIYITGSSESSTMARIQQDHPFAVLIKPIDPAELGATLMRASAGRA